MATLTDEHRAHIVRKLACFASPTQVREEIQQEYGVDVTPQQIAYYNPENESNDRLSEKWERMFRETRERYRNRAESIAVANETYRLEQYQRMLDRERRNPDPDDGKILQILKQAAKDSGGRFTDTQKLEHSGPEGGAVPLRWYDPDSDGQD